MTQHDTNRPDVTVAERVAARDGLLWRTGMFMVIFVLLQSSYAAAKDTWVERLVIDQMTVRTAAWLITMVDPGIGVEPDGSRLRAIGGGINVLNGCEGADVLFLMISAILVAPIPMRARMIGLMAGTAWVLVLNQARIIALFYAFRTDKMVFALLHGVVSPLALIIAASVFFVVWLDRHASASRRAWQQG